MTLCLQSEDCHGRGDRRDNRCLFWHMLVTAVLAGTYYCYDGMLHHGRRPYCSKRLSMATAIATN